MPELTGQQIALGKGGKPLLPDPGAVGVWSCCLCGKTGKGTLADGHTHYMTYHFDPKGPPRCPDRR